MSNENKQNGGRKYIVLDIVFYGGSLNYDQGTGNYQELKKITKWDGKEYTFVSRYALRYSILRTAEELGIWESAPGTILEKTNEEGGKAVIQPTIDALLSGEIFKYPEFDLFGYLITSTTPQNSREAPVKITHAISLTPYNYDTHLANNLGYAKRMIESGKAEKMDPNLFILEEHHTFYIYTILIDVDRIGKFEVYLAKEKNKDKEGKKGGGRKEEKIKDIKNENNKLVIEYENNGKKEYNIPENLNVKVEKDKEKTFIIRYSLKSDNEKRKRIIDLIKVVLNLNRSIKARNEFLQPKLLILGLYKGVPYQSLKDRIVLKNEYEEIYEESVERKNNGVRVIRRIVKLERPTFKIEGELPSDTQIEQLDEKILNEENKKDNNAKQGQSDEKKSNEEKKVSIFEIIENFLKNESVPKLYVFHAPEIKVILNKKLENSKKNEESSSNK
ncbi:MAG: type I-B CRISPR-associated protein Cas7/Cst2/DevR [Nanopusillaceae archaeon]